MASDDNASSGRDTIRKENRHGVEKDYVRVDIGTTVLEVPKRLTNPITERTHDLTNLSDDGYLKPFLAHLHASNSPDVVDLGSSPVLTFDKDRWKFEDRDGIVVIRKREAETPLDGMVMNDGE